MKPLNEWPLNDAGWFIIDIICVICCTLVMAVTGFNIIAMIGALFCTIGGVGIFIRNNPGSIKG